MNRNNDLQKFSLGWSSFKDVGNGDGGVTVGEVGVVTTARDSDAEAIARNSLQNNIVILPDYPLASLKGKKQQINIGNTFINYYILKAKNFVMIQTYITFFFLGGGRRSHVV